MNYLKLENSGDWRLEYSVVVKTENIKKTMQSLMSIFGCEQADFTLEAKSADVYFVDKTTGQKVDRAVFCMHSENHGVVQEITAILHQKSATAKNPIKLRIKGGKLFEVYAALLKETAFEYDIRTVYSVLKQQIISRMLENGLVVGLFDVNLDATIRSISDQIVVNNGKIVKDFEFLVASAFEPQEFVAPWIEVLVEKTADEFYKVTEDMPFLRTHKYIQARNGRDLTGKIIPRTSQPAENITFKLSCEELIVKEHQRYFEYKSTRSGHVSIDFENQHIFFGEHIETESIRTKSELGDTTFSIAPKDGDAVASVRFDCKRILTEGSLATGSVVNAETIVAGHQQSGSVAKARKLVVDIVKGNVFSEHVEINKAETGAKVYANRVFIKEYALSAEIHADYVSAELVKGQTKIYATKSIKITAMQDEGSVLCLRNGLTDEEQNRKNTIDSNLKKAEKEKSTILKSKAKLEDYLRNNEQRIQDVKGNLEKAERNGAVPTDTDKRIEAIVNTKERQLQEYGTTLREIESRIAILKAKKQTIEDEISNSSITVIFGVNTELTKIIFFFGDKQFRFSERGVYKKFYFDTATQTILGEKL